MPWMCRAARPMVWMTKPLGAQEAFLVRIGGHQRELGDVEALAQQVDADQHVELAQPQVADDLDALDGIDVGVQITHLGAVLAQVVGQVLGHALGQRGDQHALAVLDACADLGEQVIHLRARRPRSPCGSMRPVGRTTCSTTCP